MPNEEKSPVDQALDLFVYAPLGLAYEAKDLLPKLAKRGKGQADLLRVAGEFALRNAQGDLEGFLRGASSAAGFADGSTDDRVRNDDPVTVPIANYDDLVASEIVKMLGALSVDELEAIREYEAAGRGRITILNKIRRLTVS